MGEVSTFPGAETQAAGAREPRWRGVKGEPEIAGVWLGEHFHPVARRDHLGLGQTAANPVTSSLRFFPVAYLPYLLDNPRMDSLELLQSLEALRLITREDPGPTAREVTFSLKEGLISFMFQELEKRGRFRPAPASRSRHFLRLLDLTPAQVGLKGVRLTFAKETVAHHPYLMLGEREEPGAEELPL